MRTTKGLRMVLRRSTPLRPIAAQAQHLASTCDELLVATAFVSENAFVDVVETALQRKAAVRFLTGTFGRITRLRTFKRLSKLADVGVMESRVWDGDFHAKLLLWRKGAEGTAWIGSANLTDRGLVAEGELVAELSAPWSSTTITAMRRAFEYEWHRAHVLNAAFLSDYREAPRGQYRSLAIASVRRQSTQPKRSARDRRMLVVPVAHHFADTSRIAVRVTSRLGGTAAAWYRSNASAIRHARCGDSIMLFDPINGEVELCVITDRVRDGNAWVLAYERFRRGTSRRLTPQLRRNLVKVGLSPSARSFRTAWVEPDLAASVVGTIFGPLVRKQFTGGRK